MKHYIFNKSFAIILYLSLSCNYFLAFGQEEYQLYTAKTQWSLTDLKSRSYRSGLYWGYTIEQQNKMFDRMKTVINTVRKTPFFADAKGYNIGVFDAVCSNGCDRGMPIISSSGMIIRYYYTTTGSNKVQMTGEGPSLNFYFNDIAKIISKIPVNDDQYFPEPAITRFMDGVPIYNDYFAVLTNSKKPIFTILTKERYYQIAIKEKAKILADFKNSFNQTSQYKQWLANKEANKQAVFAGLDMLAKTNPEKAKSEKEKYLKGVEETEKMYRESEGSITAQQNQTIKKNTEELELLKSTFASLSTIEKLEPYVDDQGQKFVQPNKKFFNMNLPKDEIQIIVIDLFKYKNGKATLGGKYADIAIKTIQDQIDFKPLLNNISK